MANSHKTQHILGLLEAARCNGNWTEASELLRKLVRHPPEHKSIIETVQAEIKVADCYRRKTDEGLDANDRAILVGLKPSVLAAAADVSAPAQNVIQSRVCAGWLDWALSEHSFAESRLIEEFDDAFQKASTNALTPWTEVCVVKGFYLKGSAQLEAKNSGSALETFDAAVSWISSPNVKHGSTPQCRLWSEALFAKSALTITNVIADQEGRVSEPLVATALKSFRLWTSLVGNRHETVSTVGNGVPASPGSHSYIWKKYYDLLSEILNHGLPYHAPKEGSIRVQFATELRHSQRLCTTALLENTTFPRANGSNVLVETWVDQVFQNWRVLCGPNWQNEDLGEGGQESIARELLDLFYRCAEKTFHSLLILRRLFQVHASLTEFDLAIKAFDIYKTLCLRAKERSNKSPEFAHQCEDERVFAETASEAVLILCAFGQFREAEKAKAICDVLQDMLNTSLKDQSVRMAPKIEALVLRAVGVGLATWARWIRFSESRADLQASAITILEKAASIEVLGNTDLSATFALGLLLAETGDLDGAIDYVRTALIESKPDGIESSVSNISRDAFGNNVARLWHLLALLLSAKQDFDAATKACEAGLNDIEGLDVFSQPNNRLTGTSFKPWLVSSDDAGSLPRLEAREKESVIEMRITQLSLIELNHGPEIALNHSDALLKLFGLLFPDFDLDPGAVESVQTTVKSNNITPKSTHLAPSKKSITPNIRGSIFSRRKSSKRPSIGASNISNEFINIDVNGSGTEVSPEMERSRSMQRNDSIKKERHLQPMERHSSKSEEKSEWRERRTEIQDSLPSRRRDLSASGRSVGARSRSSARHPGKAPVETEVDTIPMPNLLSTLELIKFSKQHLRRHAIGLLIKIWLFITGLYRRASLFEDAKEACKEASELAYRLELLLMGPTPSAAAFAEAGWGISASSDALQADIWAERGVLAESEGKPHEAIAHFEEAIMYQHDHVTATVRLSSLLLDIYDQKVANRVSEPPLDVGESDMPTTILTTKREDEREKKNWPLADPEDATAKPDHSNPDAMDRLTARERAQGLLSILTTLGCAWDNSEAWFSLARAHEQGEEIVKAKELLWWCIELEDKKPIRHWWNLGSGGYVL